jgi:hypothetical protein
MFENANTSAGNQFTHLGAIGQEASVKGTSLASKKLDLTIKAQDSNVYILSLKDIKTQLGAKDALVVSVLTKVLGNLPAASFLMIGRENALKIISVAIGAKSTRAITLFSFSSQITLKILGEILTSSYSESLISEMGKELEFSVGSPEIFSDNWNNTLELIFSRLNGKDQDSYLVFTLSFNCEVHNNNYQGFFVYLVDRIALKNLLNQ